MMMMNALVALVARGGPGHGCLDRRRDVGDETKKDTGPEGSSPRAQVAPRPSSRTRRGRTKRSAAPGRLSSRAGFSLVEVIVAMLVLTVGLLGLAAGTGWMLRTVEMGELETTRSAALQSAVESLRAEPFGNLADGSETFGDYTVSWTLGLAGSQSQEVEFVVTGPGRVPAPEGGMPTLEPGVSDTFHYQLLKRD